MWLAYNSNYFSFLPLQFAWCSFCSLLKRLKIQKKQRLVSSNVGSTHQTRTQLGQLCPQRSTLSTVLTLSVSLWWAPCSLPPETGTASPPSCCPELPLTYRSKNRVCNSQQRAQFTAGITQSRSRPPFLWNLWGLCYRASKLYAGWGLCLHPAEGWSGDSGVKSLPDHFPASPLEGQLPAFPAEALRLRASLFSILCVIDTEQHLQIF